MTLDTHNALGYKKKKKKKKRQKNEKGTKKIITLLQSEANVIQYC